VFPIGSMRIIRPVCKNCVLRFAKIASGRGEKYPIGSMRIIRPVCKNCVLRFAKIASGRGEKYPKKKKTEIYC
jgi:membrane-bound inhibitor of C-type lysozyme